jgi:2-polyprenyl-3-methyl-5-hydroxy-6-metoxy-1,4-benzoquinol methylase
MQNFQSNLKAKLWRSFGDKATISEWDGPNNGGGKMSQRYWEYFKSVEMLELTSDSIILDLGGGSPLTGAGFFGLTMAPFVTAVHIMDVNISADASPLPNIFFHRYLASYETMKAFFQEHAEITHVTCISVFEHIDPPTRSGMIQAINEHFQGDIFVATLEYHPSTCFFESQLTARTLGEMVAPITHFYLDEMACSPLFGGDGQPPRL